MAGQATEPNQGQPLSTSQAGTETRVIAGLIALFFAFQTFLAFRLNIHWDEYFYLSHVYSYHAGRLVEPFQTFHIHLFAWLPDLPITEADQIVAGRLVMLVCEIAMMGLLYIIARTFLSVRDTAFALLIYCSAGYVLGHGASFRTDPLAAMAMTAALAVLFRAPPRWPSALIAGFSAALGLLVTIKSALFLPVFGAALLMRLSKQDELQQATGHILGRPGRIITFFALSAIAVTLFYTLGWAAHAAAGAALASGTPHLPIGEFSSVAAPASGAFEKTIASQGFFPRWSYFPSWIGKNAIAALALLGGVALAVRSAIVGRGTARFVPLLLISPLFSLFFYRNAYPYFYPFILGVVALGAGSVSALLTRPLYRMAAIVVMGASLLVQFSGLAMRDQSAQRQIAQAVHATYPDPVPYIDRNGMIPSFPKVGFFMSSWGIEGTHASGRPVFTPIIKNSRPPLLIANHPVLETALDPTFPTHKNPLHPADIQILRETYIPHWGPLFVPGKMLSLAGDTPTPFAMMIAGRYTLECDGEIILDGQALHCGAVVSVSQGPHEILATHREKVTLRWGEHLHIPQAAPSTDPIFHGF